MPKLSDILNVLKRTLTGEQLDVYDEALTLEKMGLLTKINDGPQTMRYKISRIKELALEWINQQIVLNNVSKNEVLLQTIDLIRQKLKVRDPLNEYVLDKVLSVEFLAELLEMSADQIELALRIAIHKYIQEHPHEKYKAHRKYRNCDLIDLISFAVKYFPARLLYELEHLYFARKRDQFNIEIHRHLIHYEILTPSQKKRFKCERFDEPIDYYHLLIYIDYYRRSMSESQFLPIRRILENFKFVLPSELIQHMSDVFDATTGE